MKVDDLEQYSRRTSVRVEGLKYTPGETNEQLVQLVKNNLAKIDIQLLDSDIIRLHLSSKPFTRERDGVTVAQTLVKLSNWRMREKLHSANRLAREKNAGYRVHHDLTKRRFTLLKNAREKIDRQLARLYSKEELKTLPDGEKIFAFANVNCELRIRARGRILKFSTDDQLDQILREIFAVDIIE